MKRASMVVVFCAAMITAGLGSTAATAAPARHASGEASKPRPKITLTLSPHSYVARAATLTATVRVSGPKSVDDGTVVVHGLSDGEGCGEPQGFYDHQLSCQGVIEGAVGLHTVSATYEADKDYRSATVSRKIFVGPGPTSMFIDSSKGGSAVAGSPVKLSVLLRNQYDGGDAPESGWVRFADVDGQPFHTCGHVGVRGGDNAGVAACTTTLSAGVHYIEYTFSGTKKFTTVDVIAPITVKPAVLTVRTASLPDGYLGSPYRDKLAAAGGTKPYSWRIAAGGLPDGVTLARSGTISGTPTRTGTWSAKLSVTDATGKSVVRAFTLKVAGTVGAPAVDQPDRQLCIATSIWSKVGALRSIGVRTGSSSDR